ncbi:hypothetical protein NPIL_519281 [Nephila pilipes]|uniref:Uncharacterized protein n=1 Tax=Nephila pilipes TaxID=299642 RepID=A0A8X6NFT2_NEPPI|nr:hypothetical protein NPIL_519281 [Nephila pilipes]
MAASPPELVLETMDTGPPFSDEDTHIFMLQRNLECSDAKQHDKAVSDRTSRRAKKVYNHACPNSSIPKSLALSWLKLGHRQALKQKDSKFLSFRDITSAVQ